MLYFPLRKTKINLIILFTLIMFNIGFETMFKQKTYNYTTHEPLRPDRTARTVRVNGTFLDFLEIKLPEETAVLIYIGYCIIVSRIILSAKTKIDEDEKK